MMSPMITNPLVRLGALGQSVWLDFITRELVSSGELGRLIDQDGLGGITTNPTIFEKALAGSELYETDIQGLASEGMEPARIFEALAISDVKRACDAFGPLHQASDGQEGLVSIEVSPALAHDTEGTVREAERLHRAVGRPNVMIKIPATLEGLPAIERCLRRGINVNVTLLFSVDRYHQVVEAYFSGLEGRAARGEPVDRIASVASFFVSRIDAKIDPQLDALGSRAARQLRGRIGVASAQRAYQAFEELFHGPRWEALAGRGARPQRPLWASTSTKDPSYPDVYYVDALVAPRTVSTLPPETLAAYRDHGNPLVRIPECLPAAHADLQALSATGVDLARITRELESEGVAKFASSYQACVRTVAARMRR